MLTHNCFIIQNTFKHCNILLLYNILAFTKHLYLTHYLPMGLYRTTGYLYFVLF